MKVDPGSADVSFGSDGEDSSDGELWYEVAEAAAAAAGELTRGFGRAVDFARAVKSFDNQADAAMRGWLAEAGRIGRSAPADESMGLFLQKLRDNFGSTVCCASCDAMCVVLMYFTAYPDNVRACVYGALLCGYSCGTVACPCCRSRRRLYTSAVAWRS